MILKISYFFVSVFLLTFSRCLLSQTFEKLYKTSLDEIVYDAQLIDSNICIYPLNSGYFLSDTYTLKFFKIDTQSGIFLDSLIIDPYQENYFFRGLFDFLKYNDSLFIGIGKFMKDDYTAEIQYIIHINANLNVLFDTVSDIPDFNEKLQKSIINSTGELVSVGGQFDGGLELLCEKTIYGQFIRKQTYDHSGTHLFTAVVDIPHLNVYHTYVYMGTQHAYDIIDKSNLEIDTILTYPVLFRPIDAVSNPLDTSFYYIAGKQTQITLPDHNDLSFLKVTTNGNYLQYTYGTDENVFYSYKSFSLFEDKIYFGGVYPFDQSPPLLYPEQRWILLFKLNNDGSIIWQKFYKGEVNYMVIKLLAVPDGGALILSTRYDWNDTIPNQRDVHILKIDSTGYYDPMTGTDEEFDQIQKQILVYPNPVYSEVTFVTGLYSNLDLSIYNSTGARIMSVPLLSTQTFDLSVFSPGIYFYIISGRKGFSESGKIIKR